MSDRPAAASRPDIPRPRTSHAQHKTTRTPDMSAGRPASDADTAKPDTDMDTEAAALAILSAHPDITGAELGRRLHLSDRQGRRILNALTASRES